MPLYSQRKPCLTTQRADASFELIGGLLEAMEELGWGRTGRSTRMPNGQFRDQLDLAGRCPWSHRRPARPLPGLRRHGRAPGLAGWSFGAQAFPSFTGSGATCTTRSGTPRRNLFQNPRGELRPLRHWRTTLSALLEHAPAPGGAPSTQIPQPRAMPRLGGQTTKSGATGRRVWIS